MLLRVITILLSSVAVALIMETPGGGSTRVRSSLVKPIKFTSHSWLSTRSSVLPSMSYSSSTPDVGVIVEEGTSTMASRKALSVGRDAPLKLVSTVPSISI